MIKQFQIIELPLDVRLLDILDGKLGFGVVAQLRFHVDVRLAFVLGEILGQQVFEVVDVQVSRGEDV